MTTAKVGPTQTPKTPLCPAIHGLTYFRSGMWICIPYERNTKAERDKQAKKFLDEGRPVRLWTIPAETADDRKEAP